ncbi:MAG: MarR family winged helix-turn-helix transcriptional regulator [Marmoricola sp.]
MSSPTSEPNPEFVPMIALVHRLNRVLQQDMVREAHTRGYTELKNSHNGVFATLDREGSRAADMAAQMGMTRQSMGETVREMAELGLVKMQPDPDDRRAKLVTWTEEGLAMAQDGYQHILDLERAFSAEFGEERYAWLREAIARMTAMLSDPAAGPLPEGPTT